MILFLTLTGCVDLDGFVYNPVHCSTVDESTCDLNEWDSICAPCDVPYDWTEEHPWMDGQLGPDQTIRPIPAEGVEQLTVTSADGEASLDAYWIPSHGEDPLRASTTVLYHHGNYAGIEHYRPRVRVLHELGFNVLVWDYRGYGKSLPDTAPTGEQFLADARTFREEVDRRAPDPERVIVYGYSLGAIPTMEASLHRPACATILEAPFTGIRSIARSNSSVGLPETFLSSGSFDNLRKAASLENPVFAMSGTADHLFPPAEVQRIVDAAPTPSRMWILDGVHHGIADIGIVEAGVPEYDAQIASFLADLAPGCLTP